MNELKKFDINKDNMFNGVVFAYKDSESAYIDNEDFSCVFDLFVFKNKKKFDFKKVMRLSVCIIVSFEYIDNGILNFSKESMLGDVSMTVDSLSWMDKIEDHFSNYKYVNLNDELNLKNILIKEIKNVFGIDDGKMILNKVDRGSKSKLLDLILEDISNIISGDRNCNIDYAFEQTKNSRMVFLNVIDSLLKDRFMEKLNKNLEINNSIDVRKKI